MISTMTSHSHQIKYKKTKLENIILLECGYIDLKYIDYMIEEINIIINSKLSYKEELEILNKIKSM